MGEPHQTTLPEPSNSKPDSSSPPDFDFYTWQKFFSILVGNSTAEETFKYLHARDVLFEEEDCKRCEKQRDWLFQHSPIVTFLREQIRTTGDGPDINPSNVRCRRCPPNWRQHGGFDSNYGILLCANNLRTRSKVEDSLAHEMIHAYDHVRFKVDPQNLRHQACTEIRASTLSGECRFMREFWSRGQYKLNQGMQDCVKRRAALSMMNRPGVKDDVQAAKLVNEVWDSCFVDTRPFDEVYR